MPGSAAGERQLKVARAIKLARKRYGTMRKFATDIRDEIGWKSLSVAAVYAWEAGSTRVPAVALLAAAELAGVSLDELIEAAQNQAEGLDRRAGVRSLEVKLDRLEDRMSQIEARLS
jgi:transcriptional regulator with XRE-family HTH domain